jgi:Ca2+/H+ antiporter
MHQPWTTLQSIIFNVFCRLCFHLRTTLLCWFCLSLHVSAYMAIFRCVGYFIFMPKGFCFVYENKHILHFVVSCVCVCLLAFSLLFVWQTNTHARNIKINKGKQHRNKTLMETCRVWPREKKAKKSSEAESFKHMKIKYPTCLKMAT